MTADLELLGWTAAESAQVPGDAIVARVFAVHRSEIKVRGRVAFKRVDRALAGGLDGVAVGDWLQFSPDGALLRILDRRNAITRKAAGEHVHRQVLSANVDRLLIVTSCNQEFSQRRLERYLVLACDCDVVPEIVLTKVDLTDDAAHYAAQAGGLLKDVRVHLVNALDAASLHTLSSTIRVGETLAVVGSSGVGKSTLLQLIGGLDRIDGGTIRIGDTNMTAADDDARVAFRNRQVGFVFQFHHLLPEFTAAENVAMPLRIARVAPQEAQPRAEALLGEVGLGDRVSHRPGMLSGGEQQRVAVARALIMKPALLLADEPTGDLDEQTAAELHVLLRRMHTAHGLTSLIATHNMQLAESCDRVLRLEAGRLRPV